MNLEQLKLKQIELYEKIADATSVKLDSLLDELSEVDRMIDEIENPPLPPLTIYEFEDNFNIKGAYESFRDECGDAAALYSDYLEYHYADYLSHYNRGLYYIPE